MQTVIPENIAEVSLEDIAKIEAELVAEFDALLDAESTDVASMTEIADAIEAVRAEQVARAESEKNAAEAVAALADRVHVAQPEAEIVAEPEAEVASDDADETEAVAEIAEESTTTPEVTETEATAEENELVTASADKTPKAPSASAVARRSSTPQVAEAQPEVVITAAADVPGFSGGSSLDKLGIAKALHAKARTLSNGSGMVPVASINVPITHKLGADLAYNMDVIDQVTAPQSLTAAGWCAPSNNLYTLFGIDAAEGLLDLPTVQVTRGGLNVPNFLGFQDATENGGLWTWTEYDQDNAGTKPCVYIPCPDFTDYRLEAEGICVTNGNLTDRAFPELTQRYVQLVVNTHLHRMSAAMINKIVNASDSIFVGQPGAPVTASAQLFYAIDAVASGMRAQYRMSVNSVIEAIFPIWVRDALRADFAMRAGVNMTNVTDAEIDAHFAIRKIRPQFVQDMQPNTDFYGAAENSFPTSVEFLMYPAGSFIKGDGGTIDLGVVRDSVLNATNDYTAAWTEQTYLVAQLGPRAKRVNTALPLGGYVGCCPASESPVY